MNAMRISKTPIIEMTTARMITSLSWLLTEFPSLVEVVAITLDDASDGEDEVEVGIDVVVRTAIDDGEVDCAVGLMRGSEEEVIEEGMAD